MKRFYLIIAAVFFMVPWAVSATLSVPANIQVTLAQDDKWELSWDAPDTSTIYYEIFGSTGVNIGIADIIGNTHTLSFKDSVTVPGTPYNYKIRAVGVTTGAVSDLSACAVIKTAPMPPDFGSVTLVAQNSKILIKWETGYDTDITSYNIYRSSTGSGFTKLAYVPSNQGQYLDTGAVNGIGLFYKISGQHDGEGPLSTPKIMTACAAPFAPLNVSAAVSVSGDDIVLNWSNLNLRGTYDVSHFNFYRSQTSSVVDAIINSYTTVYTDAGPVKGFRYNYRITAEDVNGNTSMPSFASAFIPDGSVLAPLALSITAFTSSRVSFTWASINDISQIDGYRIYRNDVTLTTAVTASYTDYAVTLGQQYWYCVTAYKDTTESNGCNSVTVTAVPAAPIKLTVSQTGAGELRLYWDNTANETATVYNVYRTYVSGDFSGGAVTVGAKTYTDSGLATGVARYFRLAAVKEGYESAYAQTSAMSVSAPVSPLEITDIGGTPYNGYVYLSWTASADYDLRTFTVYYKTDAASVYLSTTSYTAEKYISGLTNGTRYTFKVTGTNTLGSGNTATALAYSTTPTSSAVLDKPENLIVDSPGNSTLVLSWDAVNGAAKYHVYRSLDPNQTADTIAATVTTNTYTDARAFTENALFWYRVIALDGGSQPGADYSDIKSNSAFTRAGAPENVELYNAAGGVMLSWAKPTGAYTYDSAPLKYRIYSSTQSGGFGTHIAETQNAYYADLSANTLAAVLYYWVKTVDAANYEDSSNMVYSIDIIQPIGPPALLIARPGNKRVTLNWKKVSPEYYNIYRSQDAFNFTSPIAHNVAFDGKEYTDADPSITNKTKYYYTIAAVTRGGEGPRSMTASAIPYAPPEITNRVVTCTAKTGKDAELNWTIAVPAAAGLGYDISGYNIFRSRDNGWTYTNITFTPYHITGALAGDMEIFTDINTQWDNKYTYVIKVVDVQGNTDAVYNAAFLELALPKNKLKLHANLTDLSKGQSLTWQYVLVKGGKIKVNIYTLSGVFVKNLQDEVYSGPPVSVLAPFESPEFIWDGTNEKNNKVASGVYLFMLELNGERTVEKIAIIR